jgi:hypothetical protein
MLRGITFLVVFSRMGRRTPSCAVASMTRLGADSQARAPLRAP